MTASAEVSFLSTLTQIYEFSITSTRSLYCDVCSNLCANVFFRDITAFYIYSSFH